VLTEREPLLGGVVLIGNLDGLGDGQAVENDVVADNAEVANGVFDGVNDLVIRGPVILLEGLLAGGNDLLSDGLTEGDEEDDGEQTLEEALVLPGFLPDVQVSVELESSLVGLIDADKQIHEVHINDANTAEEALEHLSNVGHINLGLSLLLDDLNGFVGLGHVDKVHDLTELLAELLEVALVVGGHGLLDHVHDGVSIDLEIVSIQAESIGHGRWRKHLLDIVDTLLRDLSADNGLASGQALNGGRVSNVLNEETAKHVAKSGLLVGRPLCNGLFDSLNTGSGSHEGLIFLLDANQKSKNVNLNTVALEDTGNHLSKLLLVHGGLLDGSLLRQLDILKAFEDLNDVGTGGVFLLRGNRGGNGCANERLHLK